MDFKKLLEVAGVTAHVDAEKKVFDGAKAELKKVCSFCDKQTGPEYRGLKGNCEAFIKEMDKHLARYEKKEQE